MSLHIQAVKLRTKDNENLQAYWYTPSEKERNNAKGKIVIASAMGVEQAYYRAIAKWLAQQGYAVLTFDCRAMGESKNQQLKHYQCNILDWAKYDYSAALSYIVEQPMTGPIYWLGHSLGGQVFPLVEQIDKVAKVVTVSSGTGYWKHNAPQLKRVAPFFWYCVVPLATSMLGYFPGKRLNIVGNLPKQVIYQWRRWCLHPEYCVSESITVRKKFEQLKVPLHSICFTDDEMLSVTNMRDLHDLFGNKNKYLSEVTPIDEGIKRVGHLGFFREKFRENLWPKLLLTALSES